MKKGETRAMYQERKRAENEAWVAHRLQSDERYLETQLARVRRQIAERRALNQKGDGE